MHKYHNIGVPNIIKKIQENNEDTTLCIRQSDYDDYVTYDSRYARNMLVNTLNNNKHINELMVAYHGDSGTLTHDILEYGGFNSIIMNSYNDSINATIMQCLNDNHYFNLIKLKLGSVNTSYNRLSVFLKMNHSLETLQISCSWKSHQPITRIISELHKSNIKTLTINFTGSKQNKIYSYINNILKIDTAISRLHIVNDASYYRYSLVGNFDMIGPTLIKNHNIIEFTIESESHFGMEAYTLTNKNRFLVILMCFNRRIIPKCVSMNLIWPKIIN